MPTYITFLNYTQQGMEKIKESPNRLDAAKQAAKSLGGEIKAFYLTMGRFDAVLIEEAPNEEAVARLLLAIGAQGNVRTETLRAFTEEEYRKLVAGMP
jgi:uncharacterized protein with GYD domain